MKKLLIIITCFASLCLNGCSIAEWRLVHRIDVQQGNVITQDVVNQLKPGMSRQQVQFLVGSPMIVDTFHQDRWDFIYRMQPGKGELIEEHVVLFFENDALTRISGTLHPDEETTADSRSGEQVSVIVPAHERIPPGILNRLWHWITFRDVDEI